jgi:hypothetical protein
MEVRVMSHELRDCKEIDSVADHFLRDCLKPWEQHALNRIEESVKGDQSLSLKTFYQEQYAIINEALKLPTPGVISSLRTEIAARVRHEIFGNTAFSQYYDITDM